MKFSRTRPVKLVMLGAGGTGGYAAPYIYRLLYSLDRPARFILCDGDVVEEKNLNRQNFTRADLGENKAKVLAERYAAAFGMETEYVPSFVESEETLTGLLRPARMYSPQGSRFVEEQVVLLGCVDNNRSRQLCHRVFQHSKELIYIDSGNGLHTGQVVCGVRRAGKTMYAPVCTLYPDALEVTDKFPTELSCAEAAVSSPQSMAANISAATAMTVMLYNILLLGENSVHQTTFSTKQVHIKPTMKKRRKTA